MSRLLAAKCLALALDNSSREEALIAFGRAWTLAQRDGIKLSSIHTITEEAAPISDERERELVEKYNTLLREAKNLRQQRDTYRDLYRMRQEGESEAEKKLERLKKYVKRL